MDIQRAIKALFTARWSLKNPGSTNEFAYEQVTDALINLGGLNEADSEEPERPSEPPKIILDKSPIIHKIDTLYKTRGHYKTPSGNFKGLVVHYTVSGRSRDNATNVVRYLGKKGLGALVMDEFGDIHIPKDYNILSDVVYHAGKSKWKGENSISRFCIGMEICCWGKRNTNIDDDRYSPGVGNIEAGHYEPFTKAQEESLINFIKWCTTINPEFDLDWVVGHDEISPGRKNDPGASLSMNMPEFRKQLKKLIPNP